VQPGLEYPNERWIVDENLSGIITFIILVDEHEDTKAQFGLAFV
jgi:hypothetical protein